MQEFTSCYFTNINSSTIYEFQCKLSMKIFLSVHRAFCSLITHQHIHISTHAHTHARTHTYTYILFKKSKTYIETLKTLLHVSITRSSSGSMYCSLLKLQFKTISVLLGYVNFGAVAACRVL